MLFKYEFLKIIKRKSTIIIFLLGLLMTTVFFSLPIIQYQAFTQEKMITGLEGISYNKNNELEMAELLTEEVITDLIFEYQQLFEDPSHVGYDGKSEFLIDDAYWEFEVPRLKFLRMAMDNYSPPDITLIVDRLREVDLTNGAQFYETRNNKIETLVQNPERELSVSQQDFWLEMNSQVQTPFEYGFSEGWNVILSATELLLFGILLVCIILAPVFAGEYQSGADAIILSSKYGKTKLSFAKITAALWFGLLVFSFYVIVACSILLLAFGVEGWNLLYKL